MIEKEFLLDYIKQNKVCPPDEKLRDSWYNNYLNNVMASVKDSDGQREMLNYTSKTGVKNVVSLSDCTDLRVIKEILRALEAKRKGLNMTIDKVHIIEQRVQASMFDPDYMKNIGKQENAQRKAQ